MRVETIPVRAVANCGKRIAAPIIAIPTVKTVGQLIPINEVKGVPNVDPKSIKELVGIEMKGTVKLNPN